MKISLLCSSQCTLGEGPFWYNERCYWFDILENTLHCCALNGTRHQTTRLPEMFSAAAPLESGGLLMASESALWHYQQATNTLEKLHDLEADNPLTRSNDGRADRQGGFWIGTMGRQLEAGAGAIYRYYQGELVKLQANITIPNALCFSPDGDYAYFTDTPSRIIHRWPLDKAGWPAGEPQVWVEIAHEKATPDGAVVDRDGHLWNAQWGTGQVVRYSPDGQPGQVIQLPTDQSSCPAFAGSDLSQLLITTARTEMSPNQIRAQPEAGNTFIVPLMVPGLADGSVKA